MSDFNAWFGQREGVAPQESQWFGTFMISNDANEVEQLFLRHQATLLSKEMVEELEGMIAMMKGRGQEPRALLAIGNARDRLLLIKDTQRWGVNEALRRHQQIAACRQKLARLGSIERSRSLTDEEEREAGDAHYTWGLVLMSNSPADPLSPALIIDDPARLSEATDHFATAGDEHYQPLYVDEYAEVLFRDALIVEKGAELILMKHGFEQARGSFERAQHWFERAIFHANKKKPYYQARLDEFLRRSGMNR